MIQEDCYWYIDGRVPEDKQIMLAMCTDCHDADKMVDEEGNRVGWLWAGAKLGYKEDWDGLTCKLCEKLIFSRKKSNDEKIQTDI